MKCRVNQDKDECFKIEERRCEGKKKGTFYYENCMIDLEISSNKNATAWCE